MRNSILIFALALASVVNAQSNPFFDNVPYKKVSFRSDIQSVDFIVITDSVEVIGVVRNYEYENPLTFFAPGSFAAVGVSLNEDGTVDVVTDPFIFKVEEETENLSHVKL